jgi:hypothetical protein
MDKAEAINAIKDGKKVKHEYFSDDEWIVKGKSKLIQFEDGIECSCSEFFRYRNGDDWNCGWSVVE